MLERTVPANWDQSNAATEIKVDPKESYPNWHRNDIYEAVRTDPAEAKTKVQLFDLAGVPFEDYKLENGKVVVSGDENTKKWEEFLNQLTWEEMWQIVSNGSYTRYKVDSIGMPTQSDQDGPTQLGWFATSTSYYSWLCDGIGLTTSFPPAWIQACTWNVDIAYEIGKAMGNEALLLCWSGLYGYSMDTHRSAFGGRNFEYFSEDGVLAGKIAAAANLATVEKGITTYIKHMFLNEQETNRGSVLTWCTEQAMREIYLRPFELCIKEGRSTGIMNSMNRIGTVKVYANGALHDGILHNEWNFKGITLTDAYNNTAYAEVGALLRNGVDLPLGTTSVSSHGLELTRWDADKKMVYVSPESIAANMRWDDTAAEGKEMNTEKGELMYMDPDKYADLLTMASPTTYYVVRRAVLHILYTTVNGAGMKNGITDNYSVEITRGFNSKNKTVTINQYLLDGFDLSQVEVVKDGTTLPLDSLEGLLDIRANGKFSFSESGLEKLDDCKLKAGTYTLKIKCVVDNRIGLSAHYVYEPTNFDRVLGRPYEITFTVTVK